MIEKAGWTGFLTGLIIGATMMVTAGAGAHGVNNKAAVKVEGYALCAEDARLVPVWHHGYNAESVSGWVYKCKNFDEKGRFAR